MFEIFRIPKNFWKLMTSCWENWDFSKIPVPLCSIIFINILSQLFWSSGQDSELQIQRSWVQSPPGKIFFWKFLFFSTRITIFYVLIHRKRYKWTLFYFLKVYNNCSFSFSSKMTFSISQLDVTDFKNWDMPKKRFSEYISEMPTNILEHFFSRVFLQKFNSLVWRLGFKLRFRSRMSSKFKNNRGFWSTSKPPYNGEEKSHGALF